MDRRYQKTEGATFEVWYIPSAQQE